MTWLNGPIHTISKITIHVMASASEAEIYATFINGKESIPIQANLDELGQPQPPIPICVDNSTAAGFANDTIKQKRSKAIDMRFYWVQDRTLQKQFLSIGNLAILILEITTPRINRPPIIGYSVRPIWTQTSS